MPVEVILPKVDMDMASGKVMTWHVAEGELVRKGAALFDIETDKAAMEVEAEADGYLHHRVPEGTEAAIGAPMFPRPINASLPIACPCSCVCDFRPHSRPDGSRER